jgi:hypothetical protein
VQKVTSKRVPVDWLDLLREMGLSPLAHAHIVIIYLPNKDKDGKEFDVEPWETEALKLQGRLFRGATSYPSRGSYRQSDETGEVTDEGVMIERTRMVVSFVAEKDFNQEAIKAVGAFMRRFKRQTRQDSLALVVDGEMYYL